MSGTVLGAGDREVNKTLNSVIEWCNEMALYLLDYLQLPFTTCILSFNPHNGAIVTSDSTWKKRLREVWWLLKAIGLEVANSQQWH